MREYFETSSGEYCFINLYNCQFNICKTLDNYIISDTNDSANWVRKKNKIEKDFSIIGLVHRINMLKWEEILDSSTHLSGDKAYRDYNFDEWEDCWSIDDSIQSLLYKLNIFLKNPYGEEPPHNRGLLSLYPTGSPFMDASLFVAKKWEDAEKRKGNWLLIKFI